MPPEGVEWKPHGTMLSFEEILRVVGIMAGLGIRKIKVTGGEPLVRRGVAAFIKKLKAIPGIEKVTLTTNGFFLAAYLDEAEKLNALPNGVNISLDALDPGRFARIARCGETGHVGTCNGETLDGKTRTGSGGRSSGYAGPAEILLLVDRLLEKGIPVKLNCVPIRTFNEDDILRLAALARDKDIAIRFIELMPWGSAAALQPVPGPEVASLIEKAFGPLEPFAGILGSGPAVYYSLSGFTGKIGLIDAVSHGFCETCNRLRLTSEGLLKLCLSNDLSLDIRELLRGGASGEELVRAIGGAVIKKPRFHNFSGIYGARPEEIEGRHSGGMFGIGG